jgi:archaellum biogenesis ATPase FlaH
VSDLIDFKKELTENKTLLLVIPSINYKDVIVDLAKQISGTQKIGYITMNKTIKSLKEIFQKAGVNDNNFFYIDAITKTMTTSNNEANCIFCSSPNNLTEIGVALSKLRSKNPDIIILDSLSTLLVYHDVSSATKFAHSMINRITESGMRGILTILEKDKDTALNKDMGMMVDKVLYVV